MKNKSVAILFRILTCVSLLLVGPFFSKNDMGLAQENFNQLFPLGTDVVMNWSTFAGGSKDDYGNSIALDKGGNIFVAGESYASWGSPVRPFTVGIGGEWPDLNVTKLDSSGNVQWNTFLGGDGHDYGSGIAVDEEGNIYVSGYSDVTWGSPLRTFTASYDAFAAKLDPSGILLWHTFLGGSGIDSGRGLALDMNGDVHIAGTSEATWGVPVRAYTSSGFPKDAFVAKLDTNGALTWNTFLGSEFSDNAWSIAVDANSSSYISGSSENGWGSPARAYTNGGDGFVSKLDPNGVLQWNTFLGGGEWDIAQSITVDGTGSVFVTGHSNAGWGSPVRAFTYVISLFPDAFTARLDTSSGEMQWHTFLGGSGRDYGRSIAVDAGGHIYVAGYGAGAWSCSPAACTLRSYSASYDAFIAQLNYTGELIWNAFLGGNGGDYTGGIAVDDQRYVYVAGYGDATWGTPLMAHFPNAYHDTFIVKYQGNNGNAPGVFSKVAPADGASCISKNPNITWEASEGAAGYAICYDTTNDNTCQKWMDSGTATSTTLTELLPNTTYYWHVRSTNSAGTTYSNGSSSSQWSFTTLSTTVFLPIVLK